MEYYCDAMKIFIDFDDTLIDRHRMTDDIFAKFGDVSVEELRRLYKEFRVTMPFTVNGFVHFLLEKGLDGERLRQLFLDGASRTGAYIFDDAIEFLKTLKTARYEVILLTVDADVEHWQWPKIHASGLEQYFDAIYPTSGKKVDVVKMMIVDDEVFIFLDDKENEIIMMHDAFPMAMCLKHEPRTALMGHLGKFNP